MCDVTTDVYVKALVRSVAGVDVEVVYLDALCEFLFPHLALLVACIEFDDEVVLWFREYHALGERSACSLGFRSGLPLVEQRAVVVLVDDVAAGRINDSEMLFAVVERVDE